MKSMVIFVVLLILFSSNVIAREVAIPAVYETEEVVVGGETTYFYAGSKLLATKNDDVVNYHYQDRLGSDVDSKSLPFGQSIKEGERFSFTGKELDSDLYYFNARYYDSNLGRFSSVDPVKDNHAYSYVMNNPMMFVDPSGTNGVDVDKELSWMFTSEETSQQEVPYFESILFDSRERAPQGGLGSILSTSPPYMPFTGNDAEYKGRDFGGVVYDGDYLTRNAFTTFGALYFVHAQGRHDLNDHFDIGNGLFWVTTGIQHGISLVGLGDYEVFGLSSNEWFDAVPPISSTIFFITFEEFNDKFGVLTWDMPVNPWAKSSYEHKDWTLPVIPIVLNALMQKYSGQFTFSIGDHGEPQLALTAGF